MKKLNAGEINALASRIISEIQEANKKAVKAPANLAAMQEAVKKIQDERKKKLELQNQERKCSQKVTKMINEINKKYDLSFNTWDINLNLDEELGRKRMPYIDYMAIKNELILSNIGGDINVEEIVAEFVKKYVK